jgi:coniferyl-aldehyde dehydrogenase
MTTLSPAPLVLPAPTSGEEAPAIARLHETVALLRAAFRAEPHPELSVRRERLQALAGMMIGNQERIREAMSADFAVHPELFSDLVECLGVADRAAYAAEQL